MFSSYGLQENVCPDEEAIPLTLSFTPSYMNPESAIKSYFSYVIATKNNVTNDSSANPVQEEFYKMSARLFGNTITNVKRNDSDQDHSVCSSQEPL